MKEEAAKEYAIKEFGENSSQDYFKEFVNGFIKGANWQAQQGWISVKDQEPPENKTVWLYDMETGFAFLGCYIYLVNDGWFYVKSNGEIYSDNGEIITECEMDEYNPTHWHSVPSLPVPPICKHENTGGAAGVIVCLDCNKTIVD
jgi:hypothetical protein